MCDTVYALHLERPNDLNFARSFIGVFREVSDAQRHAAIHHSTLHLQWQTQYQPIADTTVWYATEDNWRYVIQARQVQT